MWTVRRSLFLLCGLGLVHLTPGQSIVVKPGTADIPLTAHTFSEETASVPGHGGRVPGMDLLDKNTRHHAGDLPHAAARDLVDTAWVMLGSSGDTLPAMDGVHWLRSRFVPDKDLAGQPFVLLVSAEVPFVVHLNGEERLRSSGTRLAVAEASCPGSGLPLVFRCDGLPEVIAVRIDGVPGADLDRSGIHLSLHPADYSYRTQRTMVHRGIFVGINVIIALLALVIGWSEQQRRAWILVFLLSVVSILDIVSELAGNTDMLGMSEEVQRWMHALNLLLLPWGSYLLIRLLGEMGAGLKAGRARLYLIGAVLVTVMVVFFLIARSRGLVDDTNGLMLINDQPWVVLPGLLLLALFGIIVAWFFVEVVRLGIRLLRTKGYTRWIGGGAVASSLLTLLFGIISGFSGVGFSDWLSLFASYCSFVAVPVSITVFLAIRAAHHNKLVQRQRDDLDREVQERTSELRAERDRSDALLLNILPAEVAEELKVQGEAAARHFELASVLFTDFKGFTTVAAQVDAAELVQELNACFRAFDDIIDARGIEKIKTIGDAYMCAGGLPDPRSASAEDVVLAALEMQEFMQRRKAERTAGGRPAFDMRLGIHSGPVVAGIVGVKKFQYDIWGDTVNTASRMESTGDIGRVNISSATYELVKEVPGLVFTARGEVEVKGKGRMEMYFVQRSDEVA
ncbi:MAG: hypothetical protein H6592_00840 [Flavobacteriales bacterium]|nr:hypothetical protein [Flavobacteriales bacterium]HPF90556.1 adenylate/guanylate cyclase domain-containing protein [Flavobacteriales bacterium]